ncbi:MAG: DUF1700 domain-containing protein [Oscillospiraceae bacterium]|nr:DUF1700 domain-containing protein [Oscillospiraceae bacterium]
MDKRAFLEILRRELSVLPPQELNKQLNYYEEMLADMIEDGMSEEQAIAKMGDPVQLARGILADMPNPPHQPEPMQPPKKASTVKSSVWLIIALILGFPVWGSIAIALLAVVISVAAAVLAVMIALFAVAIGLIVSGFAMLVMPFFAAIGVTIPAIIVMVGAGLLCIGLGLLSWFGLYWLIKGTSALIRGLFTSRRVFPKGKEEFK